MSDTLATDLIWMGITAVTMYSGIASNRWELYGISGFSFLLFALYNLPDPIGFVTLVLSVANIGRMVWAWFGSRPRTR